MAAGPIYTTSISYPTATPDVVRNEIRTAVDEGRAPIPLRVAVPNAVPSMPTPYGTAPAPSPTFVPLLTPYVPPGVPPTPTPTTPTTIPTLAPEVSPTQRFFNKPIVRNTLIGSAAVAVGLGVAYFIFR